MYVSLWWSVWWQKWDKCDKKRDLIYAFSPWNVQFGPCAWCAWLNMYSWCLLIPFIRAIKVWVHSGWLWLRQRFDSWLLQCACHSIKILNPRLLSSATVRVWKCVNVREEALWSRTQCLCECVNVALLYKALIRPSPFTTEITLQGYIPYMDPQIYLRPCLSIYLLIFVFHEIVGVCCKSWSEFVLSPWSASGKTAQSDSALDAFPVMLPCTPVGEPKTFKLPLKVWGNKKVGGKKS